MDEDALIAQHVEEDSRRPGPAYARLSESGVPIWALIGYWRDAVGGDVRRAADDYDVPIEAMQAALAYYRRHQTPIDARITLNAV